MNKHNLQKSNNKKRRSMELIRYQSPASEMIRNHCGPRASTEIHTATMDTA